MNALVQLALIDTVTARIAEKRIGDSLWYILQLLNLVRVLTNLQWNGYG